MSCWSRYNLLSLATCIKKFSNGFLFSLTLSWRAGRDEILELLDLQSKKLKLPNIADIPMPTSLKKSDEGTLQRTRNSSSCKSIGSHQTIASDNSKAGPTIRNGAISQANTGGNDLVCLPHHDMVMEWSVQSILTTQANIRAAQILESMSHRNPNSSMVLSSIDSADFQQATNMREKEWNELCKSWEHSRGWWVSVLDFV